ncbi:MAG: hypothetical protein AAF915_29670 [Cyanobacteria bacterium P01_D01_bin.50]
MVPPFDKNSGQNLDRQALLPLEASTVGHFMTWEVPKAYSHQVRLGFPAGLLKLYLDCGACCMNVSFLNSG